MQNDQVRRGLFWALALSFVCFAMVGCQAEGNSLRVRSTLRRMEAGESPRIPTKKQSIKPARRELDYRHPSRWVRKLRAKYAQRPKCSDLYIDRRRIIVCSDLRPL